MYICHNCSAIFEEQMPDVPILSFWELVACDEHFVYPDYSGERMTVQDCWRSRDNVPEQDAVRALLRNMNIGIVEREDNRGKSDFCGTSLFAHAPPRNLKLAPKRFVENAAGKFIPHTEEEKKRIMLEYCSGFATDTVVAYCHYCVQGLATGGKTALHLAELLFP